ncbi:unnamed protein product [Lasius platythorax]|uniref:Uncharacterized protein n=1 Tax=Lasius platythorax TaxID=488582 RepID=A0AAV2NZI3_9HYME
MTINKDIYKSNEEAINSESNNNNNNVTTYSNLSADIDENENNYIENENNYIENENNYIENENNLNTNNQAENSDKGNHNYKKQDVNDIREWAVKSNINHNHLEELLKILRRYSYPELTKSAKTFLSTNNASYDIRKMSGTDGSSGEFVYFGIEKWLRENLSVDLHYSSDIWLQFNVDGMSLFKSSLKQFWPILCKIVYKDVYAPFCVAI